MRPDLAEAQRRSCVREAARTWESAGLIGQPPLREVESRYASDRVSKSTIWRILIFIFSCLIVSSLFGLVEAIMKFSSGSVTSLSFAFGAALALATEYQQGRLRFDGMGSESATSFLSLTFLIGAALKIFEHVPSPAVRSGGLLLLSAALFGAGWWRWSFPVYALLSAILFFFGSSNLLPFPRLAWLAAAGLVAFACGRLQDRPSLAPAHRAGIRAAFAAALGAGYAAINLYSLDHRVIEELRAAPAATIPVPPSVRALLAAATALYPLAVLAFGVRTRRRLLIDLGAAFGALSLVTLRAYVHLGPLWLVLTEAGVALVLLALGGERFLARGPNRERFGFTAEPLFEDERRMQLLSAAAVAATVSPDARMSEPGKEFSGGGGAFGGGGASGEL